MDLCLNWGSCEWKERHDKVVLRAAHPSTPVSGECASPHQSKCVNLGHCMLIFQHDVMSVHTMSSSFQCS